MDIQYKIFILLFFVILLKTVCVFGNTKPDFVKFNQCFFKKINERNLIEKKVFQLLEKECFASIEDSKNKLKKKKKLIFFNKKSNNQVKIIYHEGEIYNGGWEKGKKNGFGTFTY